MSGKTATIEVGGRKLTFTNLDKPLYPTGFTKGEMIDYYGHAAEAMLPLLEGRAVTLKRYPNGTDKPFFFEKRCPPHKPDWVKTTEVIGSTSTVNHCVIDDVATLLWAVNLAAIEFHVPMARANRSDRPTAVVFDLDPGLPATLLDCLKLSLQLQKLLGSYDLDCFAKTSGSKGVHLYVPLNTSATFEQTKNFARGIAERLVKENPNRVTAVMSKSARSGKVFVDWSQNDQHKTTVCGYSLRAGPSPQVSTPVSWAEIRAAVKKDQVDGLTCDPAKILRRLSRGINPFGAVSTAKQKLPRSR